MKYKELLNLAKEKNIDVTKLEIALEADALIEQIEEERELNISADEFESICDDIYEAYDNCQENENADIYDLAQEVLENRGYWYED